MKEKNHLFTFSLGKTNNFVGKDTVKPTYCHHLLWLFPRISFQNILDSLSRIFVTVDVVYSSLTGLLIDDVAPVSRMRLVAT